MSWTVEGVEYHNWSRYQAALRRQQQNRAAARAQRARQEAQRLQNRLAQQQVLLAQAQGNYREQQRVNARIQETVRSMERNQQQLQRVQQNMQSELAETQAEHREHVEAVQRQFEEVQEELQVEIQQEAERAERERERIEEDLRNEISQVDAKIENLEERLQAKQIEEQEYAQLVMAEMRAYLEENKSLLSRADMSTQQETLLSKMRGIEAAIARDFSGVASDMIQVQNEANGLVNEAHRKIARMEALKESALYRIESCRDSLDTELIDLFYTVEKREYLQRLQQLENDVESRYQDVRRMEIEGHEHEQQLEQAEEVINSIVSQQEQIRDQHGTRKKNLREQLTRLQSALGPPVEKPQIEFAIPDDKKSNLVLTYKAYDRTIVLRMGLDETFTLDGHGYASNAECQASGRQLIEQIRGQAVVTAENIEQENRAQARPQDATYQHSLYSKTH